MNRGVCSHRNLPEVHLWKCPLKCSEYLKKPPNQTKSARVKPKDSVTLERGHLSLFRYPTRGIGTYLGRGVWAGDIRVIYSGRRYVGYAWEVKSQKDCHLSHRKTKHFFTRWKVMCFCVIELKKRSCWIAQDIFLFLLWTSDTLPVQSSCFAPEMISLLRKANIIFPEPVVIAATTSNKLDSGHSCYYIK